jgi:hypothetical protein
MARDEAPPFGRGETFYNGGTIDSNNLGGVQYEGKTYRFEDLDYSQTGGIKPARTGRYVDCMVVRNVGAAALLPKRLATFQLTAGSPMVGRVDGYSRLTSTPAFPVDEFLPAAGVPVNDLFYLVINGPATVLTDLAAGANNVFNVGDVLTSLTAATSGATTAGRVKPQDLTGATSLLANEVQNRIGLAMSAKTTSQSNADLLIDVRKW